MASNKIVELDRLAEIVDSLKKQGKRVVLCHGVFDLIHVGHIRHFQKAREYGDVLVVTLTVDKHVNKGPGRPVFNLDLRMEVIATLDIVDFVSYSELPQSVHVLKTIKPNFYVKGMDYKDASKDHTGGILLEEEAINSVGGQLVFTDDIVFSSSNLINRFMTNFPKEVKDYLTGFRGRYKKDDIVEYVKKSKTLKVLTIGETIVDEYQYCESIGKSSKEPTLAVRDLYTKKFAGGILAVANHVSNFCDEVGLVSVLGDRDTQEEFIATTLNSKVKQMFFHRHDSPTIVKKRLIEYYFFTKMLEVYTINDTALSKEDDAAVCAMLEKAIPEYDLVIVVDFGHSMMSKKAIDIISSKAKYLALNVQANAGNMGFNVVSKFPRADYITMAEKELRLEARDIRGELEHMLEHVSKKMKCQKVVVTRGKNGSLCYDRDEGFFLIPALAHTVVDRVGAGDAFLSISALCAYQGAPMEVVGFVGNAVGAYAVSTVCNEKPMERASLCKQIETLMK
ncbi:MAG TPA: cytidyltransferase [Verrucomicrobia bacterium]|nr:MAG: hypothetical protein A2X46_18575 [Lentisphaerae bacterium GWF2_57_35]HBA84526.1 cytidyltransferase [Verrucomicrobiota bacterium]